MQNCVHVRRWCRSDVKNLNAVPIGAGVIAMVWGGSGGGSMVDPGWIQVEKCGSAFYECRK